MALPHFLKLLCERHHGLLSRYFIRRFRCFFCLLLGLDHDLCGRKSQLLNDLFSFLQRRVTLLLLLAVVFVDDELEAHLAVASFIACLLLWHAT